MNYDNLNQVHEYWAAEIFPHLQHQMAITSFDDYLKKISFLPSFKWIRDFDSIKLLRVPFVVDPSAFAKQYKKHCVAYCCPSKPEDGLHRIIYQISPTLHIEGGVWIWIEADKQIHSYLSMFACFQEEKEVIKFFESIYPLRRTGDTEDTSTKSGFGGLMAR